jgi:hypothetical protein
VADGTRERVTAYAALRRMATSGSSRYAVTSVAGTGRNLAAAWSTSDTAALGCPVPRTCSIADRALSPSSPRLHAAAAMTVVGERGCSPALGRLPSRRPNQNAASAAIIERVGHESSRRAARAEIPIWPTVLAANARTKGVVALSA